MKAPDMPATEALDFWFDFHSPWAYLAASRIEDLGARHGVGVRWRPLHLAISRRPLRL